MHEQEADLPEGGGNEAEADVALHDDGVDTHDASIAVSVEDLEDDIALALDGEGPSAEEQHRAYAFVHYLRGIAPRLTQVADAASAHLELADPLGITLGDEQGALEACRTAFRKRPRDLHVARAYRKAAMRAETPREVSTALDAEAKRTTTASDRAALHVERAMLLARHFNNEKAASYAFKHALDAEPANIIALMAQERAALADEDIAEAADVAQKLAAAVSDPGLRAEHLARAARHLERSGDEQGGLALAASARLDAPTSPAVLFVLERLCFSQRALGMWVRLREQEIEHELVDEASAWFDVGVVAAYGVGDYDKAVEAFGKAKEHAGDEAVAVLEELGWLHLERGDHEQASDAIADQLPVEEDAQVRAALWHRLARLRGEHLDDEEGTIVALEAALGEAPSYYPVLADAGRLFHRSGSRDRLIKMHRLEAETAATGAERGGAYRRLGELLIEKEATRDAGIKALRDALREAPGHLSAFVALERALEAKEDWRQLADLYQTEIEHTKEPARRAKLHARIAEIAAEHLDDQELATESLRESVKVDASGGPSPRLVRLAKLLEETGELEELVPVLTRIAEETSDPGECASMYERLAQVHEQRGRSEDAVLAYKRAVQVAPPSHPAHAAAGRSFLRNERYRELLEVLEAGLEMAPPKEEAMWLQKIAAIQDRHLGRTDDAVKSLQRALEHVPDAFPVRQTLIEILTRGQRWDELGAVLAGAADRSARVALRRGVIAEAAGDLAGAVEHYGRAVDRGSKLARWPLLRVAAAEQRWDVLERHYGSSDAPRSLMHERCRAAEVAHERLHRDSDAVRYLTEALSEDNRALSPVVSMLPLVARVADTYVRLLDVLEHVTSDPATKLASLRLAAHAWSACDEPDHALRAHLRVLQMHPADPVSLVSAELELEERRDRFELANVLRAAAQDATLEPQLGVAIQASLGAVLEQLGRLPEAAEAFEASRAAAGQEVSRRTLLALHRIYSQLEDTDRVPEVLEALAKCPPAGGTQAVCYRRLAAWWWQQGDPGKAAEALRAGLNADPCDYRAINALAELPNVSESEVIDVLIRAFELEQDDDLVISLGTTLAARLLLLGRWHTARETIDRVLALSPDSLPALMLLAETHERRKSWELAATALDRIGDHDEASPRVKLEALRRLTTIQVLHMQHLDEARGTAERVVSLPVDDEPALRAKLEIDILVGNDEAAARTLDTLTSEHEPDEATRVDDLLRLAALQDYALGDPHRSLDTLTRISASAGHAVAVAGLRVLGERSEAWEEVREALEDALADEMEAPWECAIRRRLAQVLREHLDRPEEAVPHEKRILELDPSEGPGAGDRTGDRAKRVAQSIVSREPMDEIGHLRQLALDVPDRIESFRSLRNLFLAEDDRDGAFCAEAVLVGLGEANEEEEYFYRQRRVKHGGRLTGALSALELTMLCPERDEFLLRLARAIDTLIPRIFPADLEGYGVGRVESSQGRPALDSVVEEVAALFTVNDPRVALVSPRLGPCVELDDERVMLLLPRTIEDAPPREQRFVSGALLARAGFGAVATDPQRLNAFSDGQLSHLLAAALAIGDEENAPEDESVVYLDMRERLNAELSHISLRRLEALAGEAPAMDLEQSGNTLRRVMNRTAARAAVLCTGDPAVAISSAVTYAGMFEAGKLPERRGAGPVVGKLPMDFRVALGFAVSETHMKLRQRLSERENDG